MFRKLKQALTWDSDFESAWRRVESLPSGSESWTWSRRIAEKKAFWREQGKRRKMTANAAAYAGLLEVMDGIYSESRDRKDMQDVFVEFAAVLYYATIEHYDGGPYVLPEDRLPDRWKPFYEIYRNRRNDKEADLKKRADEIGEHRFPREEIGAAWNRLMSGDVPDEVRRIWKASSPPRKSGHAVAKAAGVPLKDFVFWMVVLRDRGWMSEDVVQDEHLYGNKEAFLQSHPSLGEDMKALLKDLS
ncbi:MAG: hypothetical protein EOQ62_04305 [Mesorhizobium sp.]|uniref:hypothetical protein n=1 Tax=Mesorhizobium sp. TaxID=1871066 RepID=UPI000FE91E0A|nr:hypothetical protein [Mesorhizobium sp.]RWG50501.1 MAG: hypothetical protein EOQ62_04305 [Mesorhizobium sp.]RWL05259.1 MAG: hypothetical protein EOR55_13470 [Mesorhizobium sp.]TIN10281.1 MAG: hypothetical protein E5Y14_12215 [Mesorhizobium sp.]TIQ62111.1 MAG: hypothetical protein E5X41_29745 [Mesorhizobium sp.]